MIPLPPLKFHSTAAFVSDIRKAKAFYLETLGQEIDLDFGKNVILKCGITLWEIQPGHIIPKKLGTGAVSDPKSNRFEFYFETAEIETVYKRLVAAGAELLHPLHEEPWGQRTIRLFDPDRHLLEIGEPLEVFVGRLHAEGMTPDEITAKTGVPLEKVKEFTL